MVSKQAQETDFTLAFIRDHAIHGQAFNVRPSGYVAFGI